MTQHALDHLRAIHARGAVKAVHSHPLTGFNRRLAVAITGGVGTMWCAYAFAALSLAGMPLWAPPWLVQGVQWVSQNFIQLVLLSILMVGQSVISLAADAQRERDHEILGHQVEVLGSLHDMQVQQTEILKRLDPKGETTSDG